MMMRFPVLLAGAACLAVPLSGQTLVQRVDAVRDGTVRMTFDVREGVCGSGDNLQWQARVDRADDWEADCDSGPAHVTVTREGGRTTAIRTRLGGRWTADAGGTDLGHVDAAAAAQYFLELVASAPERVAQRAVLPAVVAAGPPVWPRLVEIARMDSRPDEVRQSAVFWVGQSGEDGAVTALIDLLDGGPPSLRERVIFSLSQTRTERADRALRELVVDRSAPTTLREKAIFWLGQGRGEGSEYLRDVYDDLETETLRERVVFAVSQSRDAAAADWLVRAVILDEGESAGVREKGIFWLGQMRDESGRLIDLYDRLDDARLRERMIFALSQRRNDDAALDKLIEIARDSTDRELRRKAVFWLGQSRDPRAVEFLAELIGGNR